MSTPATIVQPEPPNVGGNNVVGPGRAEGYPTLTERTTRYTAPQWQASRSVMDWWGNWKGSEATGTNAPTPNAIAERTESIAHLYRLTGTERVFVSFLSPGEGYEYAGWERIPLPLSSGRVDGPVRILGLAVERVLMDLERKDGVPSGTYRTMLRLIYPRCGPHEVVRQDDLPPKKRLPLTVIKAVRSVEKRALVALGDSGMVRV